MTELSEIYILDDEESNIGILVEALRGEYHVSVGLNALEALEDIVRLRPDLILLDVMMPEINGFDMCRRLKKMNETRDIPIVFITAKNEVQDEMLGFELGAVDYLTKPISPPLVRARVRTHLELLFSQRRLRELSEQLSRYLSPQLYKSIFDGTREVRLETRRKKLTIFFSDIVGFTASTEQMEPEDLNYVLNGYLERMARIVLEHGGVLDKFIGDAILVFFGDPESRGVKTDALACVSMAMEMQKVVHELRVDWAKHGINIPFSVRMGIATGFCTVGNFGCKERMDYTVIGGQVNLASRLEHEAGEGEIMLSAETWSLIKEEVYCLKRGQVAVKGFSRPMDAYEVVDLYANLKNSQQEMMLDVPGFSFQMDPRNISKDDKQQLLDQLQLAIAYLDR